MPKSIESAPKDGSNVRVQWRDATGVENTSMAHYRPAGPDGDTSTAGWWTAIDSDTLKRIQPHSWFASSEEDEDE